MASVFHWLTTRRKAHVLLLTAMIMILVAVIFAEKALTRSLHRFFSTPRDPTAEPVAATVETQPMPHNGDSADDPAIWIHPTRPEMSTIIGTDKKGGLAVYDRTGLQIQYLPDGEMNNVDIRSGFMLAGRSIDLVTVGNRSDNSIAIYWVNPESRQLENGAAHKITTLEAYGSCMYRSSLSGKYYYFVNDKRGEVEQWELFDNLGKVDARRVRQFTVGSQTEGCVADDELGFFYIAEETVGIWKYSAEPIVARLEHW